MRTGITYATQRYPWISAWTPINEPVVTARFSGLYGHWYPHHRDDASFCRINVNECKATILAMAAVRRVNPRAEYVHSDDAGTVYSTPPLVYQAEFENARRDVVLELLHARVTPTRSRACFPATGPPSRWWDAPKVHRRGVQAAGGRIGARGASVGTVGAKPAPFSESGRDELVDLRTVGCRHGGLRSHTGARESTR